MRSAVFSVILAGMQGQQNATAAIGGVVALLLAIFSFPGITFARVTNYRVTVPFQFVVGRETLPAANYTIQVLLGKSTSEHATGLIVLKTSDSRVYRTAFTTVRTYPSRPRLERASLFFTLLQGKQHLTRVLLAGGRVELALPGPPQKKPSPPTTEIPMDSPSMNSRVAVVRKVQAPIQKTEAKEA